MAAWPKRREVQASPMVIAGTNHMRDEAARQARPQAYLSCNHWADELA